MSDNGDPDNFATLLNCAGVQTGANAARWCDSSYDKLIQQAIKVSVPAERAKLYQQAQVIFAQQAPLLPLANGKVFYATRSNVSGYVVDVNGSDFAKAKIN
ncbi:Periplasmic dipeptide transport protein precursor [compost metagenome]